MDAFAYRAGLVPGFARFARHSRAPGQHPRAVAAPRQVWVRAMFGLSGRTKDLDALAMRPLDVLSTAKATIDEMVFGAEAAIGHLHHPCIGVRRGRARLPRLLAVAALFLALLSLLFDLGERRLRRFHARAALTRRSPLGRPDALIAAIGARIDLALEVFHHRLSQCQIPVERRLAPERGGPGAGTDPHPVLRQA